MHVVVFSYIFCFVVNYTNVREYLEDTNVSELNMINLAGYKKRDTLVKYLFFRSSSWT